MERTMSVEDKIRRAEEIYNRRRENEYRTTNARVRVDNTTKVVNNQGINKRLKKMIVQIITCMLIYLVFYYIINNNYIFSKDFKNKCEEILSYDISFSEMYKNITETVTWVQQKYNKKVDQFTNNNNTQAEPETEINENSEEQKGDENKGEQVTENPEELTNQQEVQQENVDENIGGAIEELSNVEENVQIEELTEEEQMKKDAEEIKSKVSFIKPLEGVVTSNFGWRNPTVTTVSKYHTGIDIGVDEGKPIISATQGTVILASSKGAYGNHLKIQIEDVTIIYAHCLSLEVKEGDKIEQGQLIAKVGSTGNSTGPHLHFEIRKEDRYVDPKLILDF